MKCFTASRRFFDSLASSGWRALVPASAACDDLAAGTPGDERRLKYATVGDTVNVAPRLEELPEAPGEDEPVGACRVLIGEETRSRRDAPGDPGGSAGVPPREIGGRTLRGRTGPIRVWRVLPAVALLAGVVLASAAVAEEASRRAADEIVTKSTEPSTTTPDARGSGSASAPAAPATPPRVPPPRDALSETRGAYAPPAPRERIPFRRVGGATRVGDGCDTAVEALVPAEHAGQTRQASPVLAFRLSSGTTCPLEVVVRHPRRVDPVLTLRDEGPLGDGLHRVELGAHGVELEPGVDYTWLVRIVADPDAPSGDPVAGGAVRRVPDDVPLAQRWYDLLDASTGSIRDALLAAEGLAPVTPPDVASAPAVQPEKR